VSAPIIQTGIATELASPVAQKMFSSKVQKYTMITF